MNEEGIHQTGGTFCEYESSLDAMSDAIIYANHFVGLTGRRWTEGLELSTVVIIDQDRR